MTTRVRTAAFGRPAAARQAWLDRCYLPLRVGVVLVVGGAGPGPRTIVLDRDESVPVADDLRDAVARGVQPGDLVCLREDAGVAVAVDFPDGRPPLVSARLRSAARRSGG